MYGLAPFVNRFLFALEPGCIHVSGLVEGALGAPGQHWVSLRHANHKEASGAGGSEGSGVATV